MVELPTVLAEVLLTPMEKVANLTATVERDFPTTSKMVATEAAADVAEALRW